MLIQRAKQLDDSFLAMNEPLDIVYQDSDIVVIDKPAGLLVHPTALDASEHHSAMQMLRDQLNVWVYPVHRLDRATSGLLVFGLSQKIAAALSQQFAERSVQKRYCALVRGWLKTDGMACSAIEQARDVIHTASPANCEISSRRVALQNSAWLDVEHALAKPKSHMSSKDRRAMRRRQTHTALEGSVESNVEGGQAPSSSRKPAATRFRSCALLEYDYAVDRYPTARYSIVEVQPLTGRPHQIRRHAKHLSHPVVGDAKYGNARHNRFFAEKLTMPGLMLSAVGLAFDHPANGQRIELSCAPKPALAGLVSSIND